VSERCCSITTLGEEPADRHPSTRKGTRQASQSRPARFSERSRARTPHACARNPQAPRGGAWVSRCRRRRSLHSCCTRGCPRRAESPEPGRAREPEARLDRHGLEARLDRHGRVGAPEPGRAREPRRGSTVKALCGRGRVTRRSRTRAGQLGPASLAEVAGDRCPGPPDNFLGTVGRAGGSHPSVGASHPSVGAILSFQSRQSGWCRPKAPRSPLLQEP
jgi:hypothetical protein